jgi:hypothetical protein
MALTPGEYEAQANRLRSQMGETVGELRSNLTPSNLASEAASRVGVSDFSWRGTLDFASTRHPEAHSHRRIWRRIVAFGRGSQAQ